MTIDHFVNRDILKEYINNHGYEPFMEALDQVYDYDFYSCSTAWEEDSTYILKAKGAHGDLIFGWKGTHDDD